MSATNSLLSANLRSHGRRYISTGLAVAISTAFIVITLIVLTGACRHARLIFCIFSRDGETPYCLQMAFVFQ